MTDPDIRIGRRRGVRLLCDDGNVYEARLEALYSGNTRSCGCLQREATRVSAGAAHTAATVHGLAHHPLYDIWCRMMRRCEDKTHPQYARYGGKGIAVCDRWRDVRLFVQDVEALGARPEGKSVTLVRLDDAGHFEPGNVRWGFLPRKGQRVTHGLTKHPLYRTWKNMIYRCENPKAAKYPAYGALGVTVCAEWHDTTAFITWIEANLGPRPAGMTLDRIAPDGNYEPGNVRWATALEQRHNRRDPASLVQQLVKGTVGYDDEALETYREDSSDG